MTPLEEWQVKDIEDTLRLVSNMMDAPKRESCLARNVMVCWNWVTDALNDVPIEETSKNGVMYMMRVGQVPGDYNKRINSEQGDKQRRICAECAKWKPGDFWGTGTGKHGVLVESKGWCVYKKNKRKRWNYSPACKEGFEKRKKNGFTYCGNGVPTMEDLENIATLTEELLNDNKPETK